MEKIIEFLSGKKTYIVGAVAVLLAGLTQFDVITNDQYTAIITFLAPLGVFTLRAGLKK
ncbi:MAG: hypothetical protein QG556_375 [Pseudomonadota bacterium]|nr:hypothetical protein [Pseudomonadota bacterium]